jgi:hypothetical protein
MLAILLAYKAVLVPALVGVVAWFHGRYARSADSKQSATVRAEAQASQYHEESGLDDLP